MRLSLPSESEVPTVPVAGSLAPSGLQPALRRYAAEAPFGYLPKSNQMPPVFGAFPVLTSALVVCRECLAMRGLGELPHVVFRVDAYLDVYSGPDAVVNACERGGSLRLLTYLAARDSESFWGKVAAYAAMHGCVYILQWLSDQHADRCEWGVDVMDSAAGWATSPRCNGCIRTAMTAARRAQWIVLRVEGTCPWSSGCTPTGAKGARLGP